MRLALGNYVKWYLITRTSLVCEIQAGDPFMLFNVQHEAFASVSGSFAIDTLPAEVRKESEQGKELPRLVLFDLVCGSMDLYSGLAVVARSRRMGQQSQKLLPTSGDTFWQIEKFNDPLTGKRIGMTLLSQRLSMVTYPIAGPQLQYKDKCRVKHMLTQKYLAVMHEERSQQHRVRHFF